MSAPPKTILATAAALGLVRKQLSPARWMRQHHDELAAEFKAMLPERPNWDAIAAAFVEHGMKRSDGQPIKAASLHRTWNRVHASIAGGQTKRPAVAEPTSPPLQPGEVAPGVWRVMPEPQRQAASASLAPEPATQADDPLARIRAEMNLRSGRKPDAS